MDRRQFLQLGSFGAAVGALRYVFSESRFLVGPEGLAGEIEKARARGKPLLVLVKPKDDGLKYAKGQALGSWLNHASEEGMADLSLVDVVCAGVDEVAKLSPEIDPAVEPWMFLVDTRGELPMVLTVDPEVPEPPADQMAMFGKPDDHGRARIAAFERSFHDAIARGVRLGVWARQSAGVLSTAELSKVDRLSLDGLDEKVIDLGAARLRLAARERGLELRAQVTAMLAAVATKRLREVPPGGAKWATSTGCGTCIEGDKNAANMAVACGMGFVPELSRRFLYFFTN